MQLLLRTLAQQSSKMIACHAQNPLQDHHSSKAPAPHNCSVHYHAANPSHLKGPSTSTAAFYSSRTIRALQAQRLLLPSYSVQACIAHELPAEGRIVSDGRAPIWPGSWLGRSSANMPARPAHSTDACQSFLHSNACNHIHTTSA